MRILITGGNTEIPIDRVRCISNIFRGRTGVAIAQEAANRGHDVVLLGNPHMDPKREFGITFLPYRTYDDLAKLMAEQIRWRSYDAIVHSAAVSDYYVSRVLDGDGNPIENGAKISSSHERMLLELKPTEKLIDKIRPEWRFEGKLVKFKLQVGVSDEELLEIAEYSREVSQADVIVANCLEWASEYAFLVTRDRTQDVRRAALPGALLDTLERI